MTDKEIIENVENAEPFWGLYWDGKSLAKFGGYDVEYEGVKYSDDFVISVVLGQGNVDRYRLIDYGKTWAFNLSELEDTLQDLCVAIQADAEAWDKRKAIKEAYEQGREEAERHLEQADIINIVEGVAQILTDKHDSYIKHKEKCGTCDYRECRGLVEQKSGFPCTKCSNNYGSMWQGRVNTYE